ncbi:MAG: hypothetical protein H8D45_27965, partial [Bacteroidetes bacterium]|nr:hypothetical protein [Bacteroidota bacterium]
MNRKAFIFIIVIMTIALIGLMVIQSYWIKNAITVKETNFIRSVNEALSTVVNKLERLEAADQFKNRMNNLQLKQNLLQSIDSLNHYFPQDNFAYSNQSDFNRFLQKSSLAQEVLESMMNNFRNTPIENRINITMLDSLIDNELKSKGINTDYEFGIFSPTRNIMPVQKTGKYPKELLNKGFAFALFPSDMFNNP